MPLKPVIAVITSIPPVPPTREIDGEMVSHSYRDACIASWKRLGGDVISVNSRSERAQTSSEGPNYKSFFVETDGTATCGKPLVLLNDLIDAANQRGAEKIVFTNSDIYLHDTEQLAELISRLNVGNAIAGRRTNVKSLTQGEGVVYRVGYDIFVLHHRDLNKLLSNHRLYFGEPWWDYHALCNLLLKKIRVIPLESIHALHIYHQNAFSMDRWAVVGKETIKRFVSLARFRKYRIRDDSARDMARFIMNYRDEIYRRKTGSRFHTTLMKLRNSAREYDDNDLHKFSRDLAQYAEKRIGFSSTEPDEASLSHACGNILRALSR